MTATVDAYSLHVKHLSEAVVLIATDWVVWEDGEATKKRKVYGAKGEWSFSLYESGVSWASSAAKYLRDKAKAGGTVTLRVDEGARFSLDSTECYVVGIKTDLGLTGTVNKRFFTATFREG